ncbi:MAG: patatin-like phospholipase family protein [Alistipes sp.]|nr:patatin-like phospholipase family protein [Alistipes sp.]
MRRIFSSILMFLLLLPVAVYSQSVGLVLSGGGAKGLYHIGVIRALEQNGIPIDYISGTSMGAIVAALYAAGYTPEEMEEIVLSGAPEKWVSGRIDDKYFYYYRERDQMHGMLNLMLSTHRESKEAPGRRRLSIPGSMINTAQIDMALLSLFEGASVAAGGDFDSLMVPFRCMATDINRHRAVELKHGDLARAVRASMAIPVAFPPIEIDSMIMCDGGCYNNFPWQVLDDAFHPDILIGARCGKDDEPVGEDVSVIDQAMALATMPTDYDMPEGRSLLIGRAVDISTLDFSQGRYVMDLGYDDTVERMPEIAAIVARRMSADEYRARREAFRSRCPQTVVQSVRPEGLNVNQRAMVDNFMRIDRKRGSDMSSLSFDDVHDHYMILLANTALQGRFPRMEFDHESGKYDMTLPLHLKPRLNLSFGGNISSTAFNLGYIGVGYQSWGRVVQKANLDMLLGPIYTMVRLKGRTVLLSRRPVFFDYSYNFNLTNTLRGNFGNLTEVSNSAAIKAKENFLSFAVGVAPTRKSVVDFTINLGRNSYGYDMEHYKSRQYTHFTYVAPKLEIERSSLDRILYPTHGSRVSLSGIYVYGRDERDSSGDLLFPDSFDRVDNIHQWWGVKGIWEQYFDVARGSRFSWGYSLESVFTNYSGLDSAESTSISAPVYAPLLHSRMIYMPEFRARRYLGAGLMPTMKVINNLYLRLSVFAMLRDRFEGSLMHYMADFSIVYHTPVGPVSLAMTKYNFHNWNNLYLTFNFGYAIFGGKGTYY